MASHVMRRGATMLVALLGTLALSLSQALPAQAALPIPLGPGNTGSAVRLWQQDLNFYMAVKQICRPTLAVDGQFGPATTNATRCFQSVENIGVDGIVGSQTRGRMCDFLWTYQGGSLYYATCT
ncbi:putative peptidoglycan binding protein [Micromonospora pisi]|uniref:Putative peptidoglycan binding protein n=1 Tax=Micromonospora pisi TaxID=589240 RepID=A0A495JVJ5_9ACTN|nr:peptidoglycan-binding domain-containing protein [Micromonospora pisi]RKR92970.1 putative peptidoglycan binding protein [Micromonospora pisi]